ncbi:antitoxin VapB family protein [Candidatus Micrarchaeota archaeon]|nr:antitoxin VapB family protein [Candidatus Micrarchaeota archaeon]
MVKVISLSEYAYKLLKQAKRDDTSFSDVVVELLDGKNIEKTKDLSDLLRFVESLPKGGKKVRISQNIDKILYGAKK